MGHINEEPIKHYYNVNIREIIEGTKSVDFFKQKAKRYDAPYQGMIRSLLDQYTEKFG